MVVIGLHGPIGSGKNYIAKMIQRLFQYKLIEECAFAQPLKTITCEMFGLEAKVPYTEEGKASNTTWVWQQLNPSIAKGRTGFITVREALQLVGTELFRECWCQEFWTIHMSEKLKSFNADGVEITVITDVRFENEAKLVRELGGTVVHIIGRGTPNTGHKSEQTLEFVVGKDFLLSNNPTISADEFEITITYLVDEIMKRACGVTE